MAIIAAKKLCNLKEEKIFNKLNNIKDIDGRLELVRVFPNNVKLYVDFAHTPDALLKSILSLKKNTVLIFLWFLGAVEIEILKKDHSWQK